MFVCLFVFAQLCSWLFGCLDVWLFVVFLHSCAVGCLVVVWLFGCLVVWLFGCLVGQFVV